MRCIFNFTFNWGRIFQFSNFPIEKIALHDYLKLKKWNAYHREKAARGSR